ncbi:MAG TPA: hypothetical protein VGI58_01320 [Streptosporangiaceae bacterium]
MNNQRHQNGNEPARQRGRSHLSGWRAMVPELTMAVILALVTSVTVYLLTGLPYAVLTLGGWTVGALAALRVLVPATEQPIADLPEWHARGRTSFTGFWRQRAALTDAMASSTSYDLELRATLQHLLAARLAERHGISLYADPTAAKRAFLGGAGSDSAGRQRREEGLWRWVDPLRVPDDRHGPGIPPRTLTAIINRLERL